MSERLRVSARRDIRARYPVVRDDHLRLLERWGLLRPARRRDPAAAYSFDELRVLRDVAAALESGGSFQSVLRALVAERQGQLALDFQPPTGDATPARVVEFARAASVTPSDVGLHVAGRRHDDEAERFFQEGARLETGGAIQQEAAMAAYRRTLALDPWCVAALVNLANLHYTRDALAEAHALYEMALRTDPACFEALFNLAHVLHDLERFDLAAAGYRAALRVRPQYAEAHFYLAVTLEKLGHSADAKPHWRRYRELAPEGEWVTLAREFAEDPGTFGD